MHVYYNSPKSSLVSIANAIRELSNDVSDLVFPADFIFEINNAPTSCRYEKIYVCDDSSFTSYENSASHVRAYAFGGMSWLTTVSLPNVTEIKGYCFTGCVNLQSVYAPNVTYIGSSAFMSCINLSDISNCTSSCSYVYKQAFCNTNISNFSNSIMTLVDGSTFQSCSNLKTVSLPNITEIRSYAFQSCEKLQTISFPNVTKISDYAFQNCYGLSTISLPAILSIFPSAFENCSSLAEVNFSTSVTLSTRCFRSAGVISVDLQNVTFASYASECFGECQRLLTVSANMTYLSTYRLFASCYSLASVYLPLCQRISSQCFMNCRNLTNVYLPNCSRLQDGAFYGCTNLVSISLPALEMLDRNVFDGTRLSVLSLPKCSYFGGIGCQTISKLYLMSTSMVKTQPYGMAFTETPFDRTTYLGYYGSIYVPASLVATYKADSCWRYVSDRIVGI